MKNQQLIDDFMKRWLKRQAYRYFWIYLLIIIMATGIGLILYDLLN